MNDLKFIKTMHIQASWVLTALTDVASSTRIKFKAAKSRSLVVKKRQTSNIKYRMRRFHP